MLFMANENNNIKELVADYDDPTAELEILSFATIASDTAKNSGSSRDIEKESSALPDSNQTTDDVYSRLSETEEYADTIRQQSLNLTENNSRTRREFDSLSSRLTEIQDRHREVERIRQDELANALGEIEEVIQDIDERLSEHKSKINRVERTPSAERVSRLLIGTVNNLTLRFPLFKKSLTIGRTRDNDIQINAVCVSRRHAVIQTDSGVTRIIDWGSKNGVQVNSASVSEHFLCHGDTIIIGNVRFCYEERKKRDSQ